MNIKIDWKPVSELPPWDDRPIEQFVYLDGSRTHSGASWRRRAMGIAFINKDGPDGYDAKDIRRIMERADMDEGRVTHWAPFGYSRPEVTP